MQDFKAFRIFDQAGDARWVDLTLDDLSPGEVVIRTAYSGINYKDALAATGKGKILRSYPLVGGVDVAGTVIESRDARFHAGDKVLVTGCGLSETRDGGYAEYARLAAEDVVPLPDGLSLWESMALGTAGFTAALCIERMEQLDQRPDMGPILVTGATGGVGSLAINMLTSRGYRATALTGKKEAAGYLERLGATEVLDRGVVPSELKAPIEKGLWGGAIDNVGGHVLGWLTRTVKPWGSIASVGLAGGTDLHTTVMPFIIRGVNLLGINSTGCPRTLREKIWRRLATDLKPSQLRAIASETIAPDQLQGTFPRFLASEVTGRIVVRFAGD
jgi:NADPH2:quinone reductase